MSKFRRLIKPLKSNSFFIFGARGTGKTTYLKSHFAPSDEVIWIDLLDPETEDRYATQPNLLAGLAEGKPTWIVIDEIQKVPKLLNLVHQLIESTSVKFVLTGSSARKLKRGSANLLAGRAFVNYLHPLTFAEIDEQGAFSLDETLNWGGLPRVFALASDLEKEEYLKSYALTYLKEEVWAEQLIKKLDEFRVFLPVAAQCNSEPVNFANVAKDVGVDSNTIKNYYSILEDTLLGFFLEPFHRSVRKRQRAAPKFFFFDLGVKRALQRTLQSRIVANTYAYGKAFEHFILCEFKRLNDYYRLDFAFYYLATEDDAEIDVLVERPGKPLAVVEIKSAARVDERHMRTLMNFKDDFSDADFFLLSRDPILREQKGVVCAPWQEGLALLGFVPRENATFV